MQYFGCVVTVSWLCVAAQAAVTVLDNPCVKPVNCGEFPVIWWLNCLQITHRNGLEINVLY